MKRPTKPVGYLERPFLDEEFDSPPSPPQTLRASYSTRPPELLNKLSVSQLAALSNCSKSYMSQVRSGNRPPSKRLLEALALHHKSTERQSNRDYAIRRFLESRAEGTSPGTITFHRKYLNKSVPQLGLSPSPRRIDHFPNSLCCSVGGKHAYHRAMRVFYNWLYSPRSRFSLDPRDNPMASVDPPKRPKLILPSLSKEQVEFLLSSAHKARDRALIALFVESGLRVSELAEVRAQDIDWASRTIKVLGKGNKEGYAPFGPFSEQYLKAWLEQHQPVAEGYHQKRKSIWERSTIGNATSWSNKSRLGRLYVLLYIHREPSTLEHIASLN